MVKEDGSSIYNSSLSSLDSFSTSLTIRRMSSIDSRLKLFKTLQLCSKWRVGKNQDFTWLNRVKSVGRCRNSAHFWLEHPRPSWSWQSNAWFFSSKYGRVVTRQPPLQPRSLWFTSIQCRVMLENSAARLNGSMFLAQNSFQNRNKAWTHHWQTLHTASSIEQNSPTEAQFSSVSQGVKNKAKKGQNSLFLGVIESKNTLSKVESTCFKALLWKLSWLWALFKGLWRPFQDLDSGKGRSKGFLAFKNVAQSRVGVDVDLRWDQELVLSVSLAR